MNTFLTLTQANVGDSDDAVICGQVSVFRSHTNLYHSYFRIDKNFLCYSSMSAQLQNFVQLDPPFSNGKFFSLPKFLPGRVNTDDFVYFNYPSTMDPRDYMVAVETIDTSNPHSPLRTVGPLRPAVELPHVHYDAYASVYVLPKVDPRKPTFYARLNRASTYAIPDVSRTHRPGGKYEMRRHGMLTAGADQSKLAY